MVFDEGRNRAVGEEIAGRRAALAAQMTELQFRRAAGLRESLGAEGVAKSLRDAEFNLQFLSEAIESGDPQSFTAYLVWLDGVLAGAGLSRSVLDGHLDCMLEVLSEEPGEVARDLAASYIRTGIAGLGSSRMDARP